MEAKEPLNIRQVGNGFIIVPQVDSHLCTSDYSTVVFNDIEDVNLWMVEHFKDKKNEDE